MRVFCYRSLSLFSSHWESYSLSLSLFLRCESETRCVFKCDCSSDEEKGATIFRTSLVITCWWSLSGQFLKPNAISLRFVNETNIFLWLKLYLSDTLPKETIWVILYQNFQTEIWTFQTRCDSKIRDWNLESRIFPPSTHSKWFILWLIDFPD